MIAMGHLGNEEKCRPWTYADVISHTNGIDAFLDGHSHDKGSGIFAAPLVFDRQILVLIPYF